MIVDEDGHLNILVNHANSQDINETDADICSQNGEGVFCVSRHPKLKTPTENKGNKMTTATLSNTDALNFAVDLTEMYEGAMADVIAFMEREHPDLVDTLTFGGRTIAEWKMDYDEPAAVDNGDQPGNDWVELGGLKATDIDDLAWLGECCVIEG